MIGREDEVREYRQRVWLFHAVVFLAFSLLGSRLFYLQVLKGEQLRRFSEANRLKKEKLLPTRGVIYDRDGKVIVDNRAAFDVILLTQYYPFDEETNARLAQALQMPPEDLQKKLDKAKRTASFYPFLLKADVSKDVIAAIEMDSDGFPGVDIEPTVQRRYPYEEIAAQMLGYIGEVDPKEVKRDKSGKLQSGDYIGKMGLEKEYDASLRGVNGVGYVEVDAIGRRRKSLDITGERLLGYTTQVDPIPGSNLHLTIDADLMLAAARAFKSRDFHGALVALDARTGEVLALLNDPSYNSSLISGREIDPKVWASLSQNKERPLRNRAIQDHYPPGSTFKLFLAIAGLAEGVVTTKSTVNCSGHMQFGSRRFHCWKRHGVTDFTKAIKESCDVFFYQLGNQLGVDRIAKYARLFSFGSPTGIRLPGEQKGLIPDTEWKMKTFKDIWHPGETLSIAIGQGYIDVTPLQLVTGYMALGNGGFVYRPYVVRRIEGRNGEVEKEFQPELLRKIDIPVAAFDAVKEGLYRVVNEPGGTAFLSKSKTTTLSGKTGTAQVRAFADIMKKKCEDMARENRHHGWFAGYAPRENPQIAVVAIAEHGCHGSSAAPIVRDVVDAYMEKQATMTGVPLSAGENQIRELSTPANVKALKSVPKKADEKPKGPQEGDFLESATPPPTSIGEGNAVQ